LTPLPVLRYSSGHRKGRLKILYANRDLTFHFFDLEQSRELTMIPETIVIGRITAFSRDSSDGFVASDGYPEGLYFQLKDADSSASQALLRERNGECKGRYLYFSEPFPILFDDGGVEPGHKRPRALNIRLPVAERLIA
jgi:hypothetical protein